MSEETKTEFRTEGEKAFPADKENENSSHSSGGEENKGDQSGSSTGNENGGDGKKGTEGDKDAGFLDHPRWKEREEDWKKRFNDQETRHQTDLQAIRDEFGAARKDNNKQTEIPTWFGGTQEQWDAYRKDRDTEIKEAEERAIKRIEGKQSEQQKAIKDATDYMQNEISALESDKELNPDGSKIDPNKLWKFVLDNDLVDSKGRWNYRAGFKMMKANNVSTTTNGDRKKIAGATTSESKAESKPTAFKTSADFKGNKRPW